MKTAARFAVFLTLALLLHTQEVPAQRSPTLVPPTPKQTGTVDQATALSAIHDRSPLAAYVSNVSEAGDAAFRDAAGLPPQFCWRPTKAGQPPNAAPPVHLTVGQLKRAVDRLNALIDDLARDGISVGSEKQKKFIGNLKDTLKAEDIRVLQAEDEVTVAFVRRYYEQIYFLKSRRDRTLLPPNYILIGDVQARTIEGRLLYQPSLLLGLRGAQTDVSFTNYIGALRGYSVGLRLDLTPFSLRDIENTPDSRGVVPKPMTDPPITLLDRLSAAAFHPHQALLANYTNIQGDVFANQPVQVGVLNYTISQVVPFQSHVGRLKENHIKGPNAPLPTGSGLFLQASAGAISVSPAQQKTTVGINTGFLIAFQDVMPFVQETTLAGRPETAKGRRIARWHFQGGLEYFPENALAQKDSYYAFLRFRDYGSGEYGLSVGESSAHRFTFALSVSSFIKW